MLVPGTRLGSYEIVSALGAGGMGEVYKARDTRLERTVAIKILSSEIASFPDLRERFEREARTVASLNHPHICTLHDIGRQDATDFLIMEYLDGETLEQRLKKGALPLDQALQIGIQIADALATAHRAGIVHRDLKPGNIMLTKSGAKLLDFGLAKLRPTGVAAETTIAPTIGRPLTGQGTILGTLHYMAPEQVEGKDADARSDIWAFGAVFYEMATGVRAFDGQSPASIIGAILRDHPRPLSAHHSLAPHILDTVITRCLAKDPDERWQSISDVKHQLISITSTHGDEATRSLAKPRFPRASPWLVAAGAAALSAAVTVLVTRSVISQPAELAGRSPVRLTVDLGRDAAFASDFPIAALSPDGSRIVFVSASLDGISRLSTRRLDQVEASTLPGTEGAYAPFFSPDGLWVGFFAGGQLKKIEVNGSAPVILCDAPAGRGASWGEDGRIVAALDTRRGLSIVTADGGVVTQATELGPGELTHRIPQMLPGGKAVLFLVSSIPGSYGGASVAVASLGPTPAKARIVLPNAGMFPRYLPTGHLVYVANGTLYAVPFDLGRLEVRGTAVPVLEDVASSVGFGFAQMDFSSDGRLLYRSGRTSGRTVVQWLSADGQLEPLWAEPAFYQFPEFSPDGNRLMSVRAEGAGADIWIYDPQRGTKTRATAGTGVNTIPIWSSDGRYVVFQSGGQLHWVSADGADRPQLLIKTAGPAFPTSFMPDGRQLLFYELKPEGGSVIKTVTIESQSDRLRAGEPQVFRELSAGVPISSVSPDGRWVAYASTESGVYEVYVRAFPDIGRQWAISTGGGSFPVWSRTANELFYRTEDQFLMVTSYSVVGDAFVAAKPRLWSNTRLFNTGLVQNFALAPDGKRFAVLMSAENPEPGVTQGPAMLMLNFFDEVRRRVASPRQ